MPNPKWFKRVGLQWDPCMYNTTTQSLLKKLYSPPCRDNYPCVPFHLKRRPLPSLKADSLLLPVLFYFISFNLCRTVRGHKKQSSVFNKNMAIAYPNFKFSLI